MNCQIRTLREQLRQIEERVREIPKLIAIHGPTSYATQELIAERTDLLRCERQAEDALAKLRVPERVHSPENRRRDCILDAMVAERSEVLRWHIARLEAQGDYRQARIWRMELLRVRENAARELQR